MGSSMVGCLCFFLFFVKVVGAGIMRGPTGTIGGGMGRAGISIFPLGLCEKVLPVTEKKKVIFRRLYVANTAFFPTNIFGAVIQKSQPAKYDSEWLLLVFNDTML